MNFKLTMAYDGTAYHGWQRQKNGITVQEVLEDAIFDLTGKRAAVTGCSRTDAGVHAKMFVANFKSDMTIPPQRFPFAINTHLPEDIRVYKCEAVHDGFNARFCAIEKTYEYKILNAPISDPFLNNHAWHYPIKLDTDAMRRAAAHICGEHDFAVFMAAGSRVKTTVRDVRSLDIEKAGDLITLRISANGFLYNMVRIITGTLVYVGCGKLDADDLERIIAEKDRTAAGVTAPPGGLSLVEVVYDEK